MYRHRQRNHHRHKVLRNNTYIKINIEIIHEFIFIVPVMQQTPPQSQAAPAVPQVAFQPQQQQVPSSKINTEKRERPGRQQVYQADKAPPAPFPQTNVTSSHQQQQQQPSHQQHNQLQQQNSVEGQRCEIVTHKSDHRKVIFYC